MCVALGLTSAQMRHFWKLKIKQKTWIEYLTNLRSSVMGDNYSNSDNIRIIIEPSNDETLDLIIN